jgi:hypothetical protein
VFAFPKAAEPLISVFSVAFSARTFQRVVLLILGAILSLRRRTVTAIVSSVGPLAHGHWSDYQRVLCRASWSLWPLSKALAAMILERIPPDQPVVIPVDDTAVQHKGKRVWGKGRHRDAIRSTHRHVVWLWGHKWVTLAINVKFPFAARPWALPVLCALYRPAEQDRAEHRRHKTPIRLAMQLVAALLHWFPGRKFILLGDGGFASHELASFCHRHRRHVTLISRFHADANLYDLPPAKRNPKGGRPRLKGRKRAAPHTVVKRSQGKRFRVNWYGGQSRRVELISAAAHWYKAGGGLTPVRWVFVRDLEGTHREEYFYSSDVSLPPEQIVSLFAARWNIEVTFQEVRTHLGFTTPRNWSKKSVLRTGPCLLGLYSLVSLIHARALGGVSAAPLRTPWYAKQNATFSDALSAVRRLCWESVLKESLGHARVAKLPRRLRLTLLDQLSRAA